MSWFGDVISDVGSAVSSAVPVLTRAITAPVTSTFAATKELAAGRPGNAFKATLSGMGDVAKPVVAVGRAAGDVYINAGKGAYNAGAGVATGDWNRAGGGTLQFLTSNGGGGITQLEASVNYTGGRSGGDISPTGYSGLAYGNNSLENRQRAGLTTAIIGAAAGGAAFAGSSAGSTFGSAAATAGGTSLATVLTKAKDAVVGAATDLVGAEVTGAVSNFFGVGAPGGTNSATPYASPGSSTGSSNSTAKLLLLGAVVVGGVYFMRKARR